MFYTNWVISRTNSYWSRWLKCTIFKILCNSSDFVRLFHFDEVGPVFDSAHRLFCKLFWSYKIIVIIIVNFIIKRLYYQNSLEMSFSSILPYFQCVILSVFPSLIFLISYVIISYLTHTFLFFFYTESFFPSPFTNHLSGGKDPAVC